MTMEKKFVSAIGTRCAIRSIASGKVIPSDSASTTLRNSDFTGSGTFGGGDPDRIAEGQAGLDAAHNDVNRGRKVGHELVDAANTQTRQHELRQPDRGRHGDKKREQETSRLQVGQGAANQAQEHASDPILLFGDREVRPAQSGSPD